MFSPSKTHARLATRGHLPYEDARYANQQGPFHSVGRGFLHCWIESSLVGLESDARHLLQYALEWAQRSIETRESLGGTVDGIRAFATRTRALAAWALGDPRQEGFWVEAADAHLRYLKDLEPLLVRPNDLRDLRTEQLLRRALARQPEQALEFYAARFGQPEARLLSSSSTARILLEYAFASRDESLRREGLHRAGRRRLRAKLDPIFGYTGAYEDGACWLALVYAGPGSTLTPPQVIRKAYEDMPNTPWPDFLPPD